MKVLSITNLCHGFSATLPERQLFKGLKARGADMTVVTHWKTPESEDLEKAGIRMEYIHFRGKIDLKAIRSLRALLKKENFDILYVTFSRAVTNVLFATRGIEIKIIGYIGSISIHWHDPFAHLSFLNNRFDRIICLSNGVEEHLLKQSHGRLAGRTKRIYKGYDPHWLSGVIAADRTEMGIPGDAMLACCVANVRKIKGIPYLIRAANHLPPGLKIYFILVGSGMDSPAIRKLIEKTQYRNNFITMGNTPDVLSYTAACDIYIQPSLTEGLGRSVIEAMCMRKPVIVSGIGGVGELIEEGKNGFFVPAASPGLIAAKLLWYYENRNRIREMGFAAQDGIMKNFSPDAMIGQTYSLFSSTVSRQ
jgi:glycosyltransferase involved in cell wall biosynthesis